MPPLLLLLACNAQPPEPPPGQEPFKPIVGRTKVVLYTSADARTWVRSEQVLAEQLVSLGLSVRDDGSLWVSGLNMAGKKSWWERWFGGPRVRGLIFDGSDWEETTWRVSDPEASEFIDPQWDGDQLWYIAREGQFGDPVSAGQANAVRSSDPPTTQYEAIGVADPSPVRFQGERYVFVTEFPGQIVQLGGDPLQKIQHWPGYHVPFATEVDGELWLLAQGNINGRRQPVVRKSRDGRRWSGWEAMVPRDSVGNCTSPVMGPANGGWVLLCVDEGS